MTVVLAFLGIALILAGLVGIFAPGLPDAILLFCGMLVIGGAVGFERLSLFTWILLGVFGVLMVVADFLATSIGVKQVHATNLAVLLATIGAVLGFFAGSLPGLLLGPFIGAVLGELLSGRDAVQSTKAGGAAVLGFISGTFMKLLISIVMLLTFAIGVLT